MECPSCQHDNPEHSRFCEECGGALERVCPQCGFGLSPIAKFCNSCGHDLSKPFDSSDSKTSAHQKNLPVGERRQVTVLFSDLSGYTAMNERLDPEEVTGIMTRFKDAAERIVNSHGGMVNQFVGDEIYALFGIPVAHEDDPQRAVRAALELHEVVRGLGDEVESRLGDTLRLHSGINTGLVVTSADGGDERGGRYVVTGDTVNTAARLVSLADTDQVLAGDSTRRQVAPFFDLQSLEPVAVKGKARPLVPYRVLGALGVASRFEAAQARGFTPYTGREGDLSALAEALEHTISGEGQFVTVSGDAGLGKSRLLYEFRQAIDREAVTVLQGRCQSFGTATPYLPFTNALRRGLNLHEEDDPKSLHEQAVANLRAIDTELEEFIPVYLHLLSIPSTEHPLPENLSGESLRQASQDALAAVNLSNTAHKPMVLILEDWHWCDEASDATLRHLLPLIGAHSLMVVVNYRPEYDAGWQGMINHQHLTLAPLNAKHSSIIAKAVLAAHSLPEGFGELIHQRTGGNPFFIEEMCLDLLEEGIVLVKDRQAALTRPAEKLELPGTVQSVIRSRLDRFSESQQEMLRLASVIGREFDHRLLATAMEAEMGNSQGLNAQMQPLIAQGLIRQTRMVPDAAYMFKHVLAQEVAYNTLLLQQRKELHGTVGQAIEKLYTGRIEEQAELLAHHFRLSGDNARAVTYLEQAGRKTTRMSMYIEAGNYFAAAVALLKEGGQTQESRARIFRIILRWANAGRGLKNDDLYNALLDAITVAEGLGDDTLSLRLNCQAGFYGLVSGYRKDGRRFLHQARKLAEKVDDREECIVAYSLIGQGYWQDAQPGEAGIFLDKAIRLAETAEQHFSSRAPAIFVSIARSYLSELHSLAGEFEKARDQVNKAFEAAASVADRDCELFAKIEFGLLEVTRGEFGHGQELLRGVLEISHDIAHGGINTEVYFQLGRAVFHMGDQEGGIKLLEKAIEAATYSGLHNRYTFPYAIDGIEYLAYLHAQLGQGKLATSYLDESAKIDFDGNHGKLYVFLAKALLAARESPPDWKAVESHVENGKRLANDAGFRPGLAEIHLRHAELLHKKGDLTAATEQLEQAGALFGEMEMTWWPEQAEALRGRLEAHKPWKCFAPYAG